MRSALLPLFQTRYDKRRSTPAKQQHRHRRTQHRSTRQNQPVRWPSARAKKETAEDGSGFSLAVRPINGPTPRWSARTTKRTESASELADKTHPTASPQAARPIHPEEQWTRRSVRKQKVSAAGCQAETTDSWPANATASRIRQGKHRRSTGATIRSPSMSPPTTSAAAAKQKQRESPQTQTTQQSPISALAGVGAPPHTPAHLVPRTLPAAFDTTKFFS